MDDIISNWELTKSQSAYHFDNRKTDPRWDCVKGLGRFTSNWDKELEQVIESAKPVSWRTRSETGYPNQYIDKEEYDLLAAGADPNLIIANFEYNLPPIFRKMCDTIGLDKRQDRIHVQWTGQVFNKHIDKLGKMNKEDPTKVVRIMIQLTDWEQGHFAQYGNYTYSHWRSGDIHTFDWKHVPHSSANAGLSPRVSLLTTGVITEKFLKFLETASNTYEILL